LNRKIPPAIFKYRRYFSVSALAFCIVLKHYLKGTTSIQLILAGVIIVGAGMAFRMYTASYLFGRHIETEIGASFLCSSGPFAYIRNPLYLGNFIIGIGMAVSLNEWYGYAIFFCQYTLVYSFLIPYEERYLLDKFGYVYTDYSTQVRRFLPRLRGYKGQTKVIPKYKLGVLSEKYHVMILVLGFLIYRLLFVK
jgi:protein-S-isoprenylcysteine O-methyltransferase Ste14